MINMHSETEQSAGAALIRGVPPALELLVMRVRAHGYELPKGHLEGAETPREAAARELCEETGLIAAPAAGELLDTIEYSFEANGTTIHKRVWYFLFPASEPLTFGPLPARTRELRWISASEAPLLSLVNEQLRPVLFKALALAHAGV